MPLSGKSDYAPSGDPREAKAVGNAWPSLVGFSLLSEVLANEGGKVQPAVSVLNQKVAPQQHRGHG